MKIHIFNNFVSNSVSSEKILKHNFVYILQWFLIIKPSRCTNFSNLFWIETLHVSDSSSVHHQEFFHGTHSNGICHTGLLTDCEQDQDGTTVPSSSCSQAVSDPVWHIPLLCVQWKTPDDGQRNCPKHVEFHFKSKFEKLVHLVGFIIRKTHTYRLLQLRCTYAYL